MLISGNSLIIGVCGGRTTATRTLFLSDCFSGSVAVKVISSVPSKSLERAEKDICFPGLMLTLTFLLPDISQTILSSCVSLSVITLFNGREYT